MTQSAATSSGRSTNVPVARPAYQASREWRDYLHSRPSRLFQSVTSRLPEAREKARGYDGQRQVQAFLHLSQIEEQPKPFYRFTEKTVRLQAINQGLQQIDSDLRDILTWKWTKLDLSSAQLGIAARKWGVKSALDLLSNGGSIWESLIDHMRVPWGAKPALKRGLYATVYGANRSAIPYIIAKEAGKEGVEMSDDQRERFFTHDVIEELLSRREEQFARIESQGGVWGCYENWIDLDGREKKKHPQSIGADPRDVVTCSRPGACSGRVGGEDEALADHAVPT